MIIELERITRKDVEKLEALLDRLWGKTEPQKEGVTARGFDVKEQQWKEGRSFTYRGKTGRAEYLARLEGDAYRVEMQLELKPVEYAHFLEKMKEQCPEVHAKWPKGKNGKSEAYQ